MRTDLIGRHAIIVRPGQSDDGLNAVIRSVAFDAVHTPMYTLELEDGSLAESSAANFRLVKVPGSAEGPGRKDLEANNEAAT